MMPNRIIETYDTEENVLQKIEELKKDGYLEKDMYIMANRSAHPPSEAWASTSDLPLTSDK